MGQNQPESTLNAGVKSQIDQLKSRLRWSDESSHKAYKANRTPVTNQIWTLIDSFIAQTYKSGNINPEQLKSTLSTLLGHKSGLDDMEYTVVLPVDIPAGKFVIAGLEVTRGGGAISEDAVSFRAYGKVDGRWALVSHVELEPEYNYLVEIHALALPQGFPGTFGFIAWAMEPPLAPFKVLARVYAFDGQKFTTVWAPKAFITSNVPSFVTLTNTGFDLHTLTQDRAREILQSYTVVRGEVIKTAELDQDPQ
jgi:hypothetical protein